MKTKGIGILAIALSVLTAAASMTMLAGCGSKEASAEATTVATTVASTAVSSTNSTAAPAVTAVPVQNSSQGSTQEQNTTVANPDTVYAGIGKQAAVDKALATQGSSYQVVSVEQGDHNGSQAWVVNLSNGGAGRDMVCYVSSNFCIPEYSGSPVVVDDPNEDNDYDNDDNSYYDDDDENPEIDNVYVNENEDENGQ